MDLDKINIKNKLSQFSDLWSPKIIAEMNDYQFKLVKIIDDFIWHKHDETDEVFIIISGSMDIEFRRNKTIHLNEGEMFVVPKGVEHKPVSSNGCSIMLIEPRGIKNTGDKTNQRTIDSKWI